MKMFKFIKSFYVGGLCAFTTQYFVPSGSLNGLLLLVLLCLVFGVLEATDDLG